MSVLRPLVPFVLAALSGMLAFAPVHISQYAAVDEQGTRYAVVGNPTRGWVFRVAPHSQRSGQALFETARLVLNTERELAAECHAYTYVGHSKTLLERTSFMVQRERSALPAGMLSVSGQSQSGQSQSTSAWLQALTDLCRSGVGAEKTLVSVRIEGNRYVPAEAPQVAVLTVASGADWMAQVVKR